MARKQRVSQGGSWLFLYPFMWVFLLTQVQGTARAQDEDAGPSPYVEENHRIRRDKFDLVLPEIMRERNIDMWIHVMREAIPDRFGAHEFGSASGVFVFTDRGGERIERAILGRRWGATQRDWGQTDYRRVEESGAYDIIADPVRVQEPVGGPMTEYDYRFKGLRAFVAARDPKRIDVNFKLDLGPWVTYRRELDGISHTDYLLLTEELGEPYADRLVSAEYVMMDYVNRKVPSEIELLKRVRNEEVERVKRAFDAIEPGATRTRDAEVVVFRRMSPGQGKKPLHDDLVGPMGAHRQESAPDESGPESIRTRQDEIEIQNLQLARGGRARKDRAPPSLHEARESYRGRGGAHEVKGHLQCIHPDDRFDAAEIRIHHREEADDHDGHGVRPTRDEG